SPPAASRDRCPRNDRRTLRAARTAARRGRAAARGRGVARVSRFRAEIAEQHLVHGAPIANKIAARIRQAASRGFAIAARGSSDNAALYAKYLFGAKNQALVALVAP